MNQKQGTYNRERELEIIAMAKKDIRYFAPIYESHYKALFAFVYNRIKDKDTVADLVQHVFLKAMMNLDKYTDKGFPFSSWLYRITLNEVNMYFRKGKFSEVEVKESHAIELMNEVGSDYSEETIQKCLDLIETLPAEQSQLIEMRFFDKMSFQEIAQIFEITEANAKMRVYRILEKLKTDLIQLNRD